MVSLSIKTLILSISVATLATTATVSAGPDDNNPSSSSFAPTSHGPQKPTGCSDLAARQGTNITYNDIANCFDSIPFNQAAAKGTIDSVLTFFNDYYVSRDVAMTPHLAKPLQSDPVDIVGMLMKIGRTRYTSDRKFHTDVYKAVESLHDGHAIYAPYCYMAYLYSQPINMYAPVINGKQVLRVFEDKAKRGYEDCTVVRIDGKDALTQVKKFADHISQSKDPNVRFNDALASKSYKPDAGTFTVNPGQFAVRMLLPENPSVRYELKCDNAKKSIVVDDKWVIVPQYPWQFTDTDSYIKNVCLAQTVQAQPQPAKRDLTSTQSKRQVEIVTHHRRAIVDAFQAQAAAPPTTLPPVYPEAIKIGAGNSTVFYQLKDRPTVGIVVLYALKIDFQEIDFMHQSLETFYKNGVTNILIDVVSGEGGWANVAPDFAEVFFPSSDPLDKSLRMDYRVTPVMKELSAKVFNSTDGGMSLVGNMLSIQGGGFYDSSRYFDLSKNGPYTDNSLFRNTVSIKRNGRRADYTKLTVYRPGTKPTNAVNAKLAKYPWTNNADRIRIVTDGRCVSACANAIFLMANHNKVKTYGIGGTPGQPLSKYMCAAGAATRLGIVNDIFAFANMTNPIKALPYQSELALTLGEKYAPGSNVPLEWDSRQYPTDYRLNYDPVNARSREALWTQVAKAAWK
ncbi:hypothetical protein BGX23_009943 [Mortierella sp. AD031]|nr:hypothetical protein BGX23_009943 [Mortierella sp. AD031]KAG0217805.1 hypothetical protein BGX33_009509 [Mortierella sp. NVP41]